MTAETRGPARLQPPNSLRPGPNDALQDEPKHPAPGDPDSIARKQAQDVVKAEDDPVANEPSQSSTMKDLGE